MTDIMTAKQAAEKWGIAPRRVNELIRDGRIEGVSKVGIAWVMPADTQKPTDLRITNGKYVKEKNIISHNSENQDITNVDTIKIVQAFQFMLDDRVTMFQFMDIFPYPMQIFDPDGFLLFANRAICEDANVADLSEAVGTYNILQDPVTLDVLGLREPIEAVFKGERRTVHDVRIPYEDISAKFTQTDEHFNKVKYQDITGFQLWDVKGDIAYIIMIFITKQTYTGRTDMIKAQEYMDQNWRDEFDRDKIAKMAHINPKSFSGLFKQHIGFTPLEYYKRVKINMIKEKLLDPNLSISKAFVDCGVDYNGRWAKYFSEIMEMSPSEYRKNKLKKE